MSKTVQQFDVTTAIRERVRGVILASMPDEQIDAMVASEYDQFFAEVDRRGNTRESRFRKLIRAVIETRVSQRITEWMDENFDAVYSNDSQSTMTGELVAAFVPVVQAAMIEGMVSRAMFAVHSQLTQDRR